MNSVPRAEEDGGQAAPDKPYSSTGLWFRSPTNDISRIHFEKETQNETGKGLERLELGRLAI